MTQTTTKPNWRELALQVRESVLEAHNGELVPVSMAYQFLVDSVELFMDDAHESAFAAEYLTFGNWPTNPPNEFIFTYYDGD